MEILSYTEALRCFRELLLEDDFVAPNREVFSKAGPGEYSYWIAMSGNNYGLTPLVGVCSNEIERILQIALKETFPGYSGTRQLTPLFRLPPNKAFPNDERTAFDVRTSPGYTEFEIMAFILWLREIGYSFVASKFSIEASLELALAFNKKDQAQQYILPIMMTDLGLDEIREEYVSSTLEALKAQSPNLAAQYTKYILNLDKISWVTSDKR